MAEKKKQEGHVIRISNENYSRLTALKKSRSNKKHQTFDYIIETLVDLGETVERDVPYYSVDNKLFTDIAEARGESILQAMQKKIAPEFPDILIKVGKDDGHL